MENISWTIIILTLGTAIITASATLFANWIAQRGQREIKEVEIKGQLELKARELLFQSYQKKVDSVGEEAREISERLYSLAGKLNQTNDEKEKGEIAAAIVVLITMTKDSLLNWVIFLREEYEEIGLTENRKEELDFINQALSVDWDKIPQSEIGVDFFDVLKAIGKTYSLRNELVEMKCEDLFQDYLPNKRLKLKVRN